MQKCQLIRKNAVIAPLLMLNALDDPIVSIVISLLEYKFMVLNFQQRTIRLKKGTW